MNRRLSVPLSTMVSLSALAVAGHAAGQASYPERPIRLVVGFPPGSQSDVLARLLGQKFAEAWGKPVLVENVPGATGSIAAGRTAKAAPDGYTLALLAQGTLAVQPTLYKLPYDPVTDFAPVSQVALSWNMLVVHDAVPAGNLEELMNLARARPGELTFASGGNGSASHIAVELLKLRAGIDIRHIPYKGLVAALPDLLGGRVMMTISPSAMVLPEVRKGNLRAIAATSLIRSPAVPELPTIAESGFPGFEVTSWIGLLAPAGTPATAVGKIHRETIKTLALPDVRAKLAALGLEGVGNSPDEFAATIKSEISKWAKVIKDAGIKPD